MATEKDSTRLFVGADDGLPLDIQRLLTMEPTWDALQDYLAQPPSAGLSTTHFSIVNVFASLPWERECRRYNLYDVIGYDVIAPMVPSDQAWSRWAVYGVLPGLIDAGDLDLRTAQRVLRHPTIPLDYGSGRGPILAQEGRVTCLGLRRAWKTHALLHAIPGVSSPAPDVLDALASTWALRELMLLAARAELGHLYQLVSQWRIRMQGRLDAGDDALLDSNDRCLTDRELGWLASRVRGYRYWGTGHVEGKEHAGHRDDAPYDLLAPKGDLPLLYWNFFRWYRTVYRAITAPLECTESGCTNYVPQKPTGGAIRLLLCAEHRQEHDRATAAARKARERRRPQRSKN